MLDAPDREAMRACSVLHSRPVHQHNMQRVLRNADGHEVCRIWWRWWEGAKDCYQWFILDAKDGWIHKRHSRNGRKAFVVEDRDNATQPGGGQAMDASLHIREGPNVLAQQQAPRLKELGWRWRCSKFSRNGSMTHWECEGLQGRLVEQCQRSWRKDVCYRMVRPTLGDHPPDACPSPAKHVVPILTPRNISSWWSVPHRWWATVVAFEFGRWRRRWMINIYNG